MGSHETEYCTVEVGDGVKLETRLFKPISVKNEIVVVLVHQYSVLGGCQGLMKGMAKKIAEKGYRSVTFDMRGAGKSTGKSSWTGSSEIHDVVCVCNWVSRYLSAQKILLVGSSAGAPIAGSAVDQVDQIEGYVSLGYPFGMLASILFGRHHKAILQSPKSKLFVMGTCDGFTSVKQLEENLKMAAGRNEIHLIPGAGHFQMEGPAYDQQMADLIDKFAATL
uniref:KANL3/Tex30 alpha/beta hydrolase-like domain-containing protein n=1 Tax=Araucaria cunninghamii TaxID=56994 RepID=A0A0D6R8A9_ARACU